MNVNEYGNVFRFNAGIDLSTTTGLTLILQPQIGQEIERTNVTAPTVDYTSGDTTFFANQYVEYTIARNDIQTAGRWRAKLKMTFSSDKELITDWKKFTVLP